MMVIVISGSIQNLRELAGRFVRAVRAQSRPNPDPPTAAGTEICPIHQIAASLRPSLS